MTGREFAGFIALMTGSADGIGKVIACGLAERGAAIILHDIKTDELAKTAAEIGELGDDVATMAVDIRDATAMRAVFDHAAADLGDVNLLVNNASVGLMAGRSGRCHRRGFRSHVRSSRQGRLPCHPDGRARHETVQLRADR